MTDRRGGKKLFTVWVNPPTIVSGMKGFIDFIEESGFRSLDEWVKEIFRLNKQTSLKGFLYKVEKIQVRKGIACRDKDD